MILTASDAAVHLATVTAEMTDGTIAETDATTAGMTDGTTAETDATTVGMTAETDATGIK